MHFTTRFAGVPLKELCSHISILCSLTRFLGISSQDVHHLQVHWPEGQPQLAPQLQEHPGPNSDCQDTPY